MVSAAYERGGKYKRTDSGQVRPLTKKVYHLRGENSVDMPYPDTDINTVEHALYSRVFTLGGKPLPEICSRAEVTRLFRKFLKGMTRQQMKREVKEPLSRQQFVDSYSGAKRRVYERAKDRLDENMQDLQRISRISCFVKLEPCKRDPRLISTRDPMFHMEFGRHIKVLETDVYEDINYLFSRCRDYIERLPTIMKSLNYRQRGECIHAKWRRFQDPVFVGLDVSRFDAHVSARIMAMVEFPCYKHRTSDPVSSPYTFNQLLMCLLNNVGHYSGKDGRIRYKVPGSRASGDMNTSLGNCVIMSALLYSYLDSKNLLSYVEVIDDGDDAGIILERHDLEMLHDIAHWYLNLGFTLKVEDPVHLIEEIEFCRCHPVFCGHDYVMCPNPFRRLYTDLVTDTPLTNETTWRRWVGAVAGSGLASCPGIPIFQSFYCWLARSSGVTWRPKPGSIYYRYRDSLADGMDFEERDVVLRTRDSFCTAFGISVEMQLLIEKDFVSKAPLVYSQEAITQFVGDDLQLDIPCSVDSVYESLLAFD